MKRRAQLVIAGALWLIAIGLLGWGFWPAARATRTLSIDLTDVRQSEPLTRAGSRYRGDADHARYSIAMEYPILLRVADSAFIRLRIDPAIPLQDAEPPDTAGGGEEPGAQILIGAAKALAIQARLEMNGATVSPGGDITSAWSADEAASFTWTVRTAKGGVSRGTAWTFLIPVESRDLAAERIAISAQPVEIYAMTFLGVNGPSSRVTGSVLMVLGTILGLPGLEHVLMQAIRRRRGQPG